MTAPVVTYAQKYNKKIAKNDAYMTTRRKIELKKNKKKPAAITGSSATSNAIGWRTTPVAAAANRNQTGRYLSNNAGVLRRIVHSNNSSSTQQTQHPSKGRWSRWWWDFPSIVVVGVVVGRGYSTVRLVPVPNVSLFTMSQSTAMDSTTLTSRNYCTGTSWTENLKLPHQTNY